MRQMIAPLAHAMLPHQGQGANQTIEDAAVLAAELDGADDIPAALCATQAAPGPDPQGPAVSWAASSALHLPDGPAAQRRATPTWPGSRSTWPGSTATTRSPPPWLPRVSRGTQDRPGMSDPPPRVVFLDDSN